MVTTTSTLTTSYLNREEILQIKTINLVARIYIALLSSNMNKILGFDDITGRLWAERLNQFTSSAPSLWRKNAENRLSNQNTRRKARKVAMAILNAMEDKGLSNEAFSTLLGVPYTELMPILKGHELPTTQLLHSIENALNISLE